MCLIGREERPAHCRKMKQNVDAIVLYTKEGEVIPLKIRLTDENGERREFVIKKYRSVGGRGTQTLPDGMYIAGDTLAFECYIQVAEQMRMIRLYHSPGIGNPWIMTEEEKK